MVLEEQIQMHRMVCDSVGTMEELKYHQGAIQILKDMIAYFEEGMLQNITEQEAQQNA